MNEQTTARRLRLLVGFGLAAVMGITVAVLSHAWGLSERQTFVLIASYGLVIALVFPLGFVLGVRASARPKEGNGDG